MARRDEDFNEGCMDKTFPRGLSIRCTAICGIVINFVLFVIGFVIAMYGARLAVQERSQIEFLDAQVENTTLSAALKEDLSKTISSMSGLTVGMTVMGSFAILVSILGLCGSVRGSLGCLYCYTILLVIVLVSQAIVVGALSSQVADVDEYAKEMIQASTEARNLVKQNGQQVMYFGAGAFIVEFVGFLFSLIARFFLKKGKKGGDDWRGNEMEEIGLSEVREGLSEKMKKSKQRSQAIRLDD